MTLRARTGMGRTFARRRSERLSLLRYCSSVAALIAGCALPASAAIVLGPAAIRASVHDSSDKPVAGAQITTSGPAERQAVTDRSGVVTFQALPLGLYTMHVTRSGYDPYDAAVRVKTSTAPTVLVMHLTTSTFSSSGSGIAALTATALGAGSDPFGAHLVALEPGTALVASPLGAGVGVVVDGAPPDESRVEIDGIPIAGGAQGFNALRFRGALPLSDVSIAHGPPIDATSVRDTIGGIVAYQTPSISQGLSGGIDAGYDSAFGAFQHARYTQTFGQFGVLLDTVTGGGLNRAQTFKARYTFSPDVSLDVASYGSQSDATVAGATVTSDAPAFAADLRAALGGGTLKVRSFDSSSYTATDGDTLENAHVRGLQVGYDLPQGADVFSFAYDRRAEDTTFSDGTTAAQAFNAYTVRGDFALTSRSRLEIADSLDGGSTFAPRSDPRIALSLRSSERLTFHLTAGSAYATEPADAFATAALADAARVPETSFGARLRADATLGGGLTAWGSAFETRRFDRPDGLPDAQTSGVEIGLDRPALVNHFGATAYLDLERGIAATAGTAYYDGVPASKARVALAYHNSGFAFDFGTTLLGANNAFAAHAVTLGDVALRVPVFKIADVRVGIENLYGTRTPYPTLAPLYVPREFTLTVGRSPGN
jgi:hypothetical protein